jgi:hypothetical protein
MGERARRGQPAALSWQGTPKLGQEKRTKTGASRLASQ